MRKYQTIDQYSYLDDGRRVTRIQALRDFGNVKSGTLGGYIEYAENLSHEGNCWIADDATAAGFSRVSGNALLCNRAEIDDYVKITDDTIVRDEAILRENVFVYGNSLIGAESVIGGCVTICDHAVVLCTERRSCSGKNRVPNICDDVTIREFARVEGAISMRHHSVAAGNSIVRHHARMIDLSYIGDNAILENSAKLCDEARVIRNAIVGGQSAIMQNAVILGRAQILGKSYITCRAQIGGDVIIRNEKVGGDSVRGFMIFSRPIPKE